MIDQHEEINPIKVAAELLALRPWQDAPPGVDDVLRRGAVAIRLLFDENERLRMIVDPNLRPRTRTV